MTVDRSMEMAAHQDARSKAGGYAHAMDQTQAQLGIYVLRFVGMESLLVMRYATQDILKVDRVQLTANVASSQRNMGQATPAHVHQTTVEFVLLQNASNATLDFNFIMMSSAQSKTKQ